MKIYTTLIILTLTLLTSCFAGYGKSAVDARIYRNISKKCKNEISIEKCRSNYFAKIVRNENGKIILDEEGKRIRDDNGNVIIPKDYESKSWVRKFFINSQQQIDAMGQY